MNGHAIREAARAVAMVVHDGQCRKGAGEPYFNHCDRVAERVWGWRRKTLAYLHDAIEDSGDQEARWAMKDALTVIFGSEIVEELMFLSRLPNEEGEKQPYQEWIEGLAMLAPLYPDVVAVKLADLEDNLSDIEDLPEAQDLAKRYRKAKVTLEEAL